MKFIISKQQFTSLLSAVQNIVPIKPTVPILSNILIEAVNDEVILTATDLTVGMRCSSEAKVIEEGASALPARRLTQLVKELTANTLEISTNSNEVTTIVADSSHFKLHGIDKTTFPALPDIASAVQFQILQSTLREAFYHTAFAVSREDTRYVLTGVLMQIAQSSATLIGTDGKRLSRAHFPINLDPSFAGDYIIPLKTVEEIFKNLEENTEATVFLMPDKIAIKTNRLVIISKLLVGSYPDVKQVIPENLEYSIALHREELISLLRQIALFTADASHSVRFTLSDGDLKLSANTMEIGEGRVSMPVNYHGDKLDIAFNPGFFLDILRHSKQETVSMGFIDSHNPAIISDTDVPSLKSIESNPLFLLMPMRLNEE